MRYAAFKTCVQEIGPGVPGPMAGKNACPTKRVGSNPCPTQMTQTRIGISGWTYAPWRGVFYPKGFPQKHELPFASRAFNSIEINGTFYSLQRPSSFQNWYEQTPDDFVFSVKGGRFITHMKKLKDV